MSKFEQRFMAHMPLLLATSKFRLRKTEACPVNSVNEAFLTIRS